MSKINIKIVEVDQSSHTVLVKYASEKSQKTIDEYPAVAFQVTNYNVATAEEFIEAIRPQVSLYVYQRDLADYVKHKYDISVLVYPQCYKIENKKQNAPSKITITITRLLSYLSSADVFNLAF